MMFAHSYGTPAPHIRLLLPQLRHPAGQLRRRALLCRYLQTALLLQNRWLTMRLEGDVYEDESSAERICGGGGGRNDRGGIDRSPGANYKVPRASR